MRPLRSSVFRRRALIGPLRLLYKIRLTSWLCAKECMVSILGRFQQFCCCKMKLCWNGSQSQKKSESFLHHWIHSVTRCPVSLSSRPQHHCCYKVHPFFSLNSIFPSSLHHDNIFSPQEHFLERFLSPHQSCPRKRVHVSIKALYVFINVKNCRWS